MERKKSWKSDLLERSRNDPVFFIEQVLGSTLWDKQKEICRAIIQHERLAIPAGFGLGKCMAYGEPMFLADGSVVPVETLIDKCFFVLAWDEKTGEQVVADAFAQDNGIREVVRVTTTSGYTLIRTLNHPLWSAYSGLHDNSSKTVVQAQFRIIEHLTEDMFLAVVDKNEQVKCSYLNIPEGYAWEKIKSIEYLGEYPTVGICVPKYHTYLTTFVEHNTYLAARLALWWLFCFPQSKVVSTAPTQRQIRDLLWAELRTAYNRSNIKLGGELFQLMLRVSDEQFAVGFSTDSENIDKFSGYHAPSQLVIFDQAAGIDSPIWEAAEGLMTSENCRWLAISNTAISSSEMANICMPDRKTRFGKWHVIQIKATESPNVLAGKNIYPGLVAHDWVKRREEAWGKDDPLYRIFVEAEFIPDSEMVVIPFEYISKAFETAGEVGEYIEVGLDVARMGTDSSVWVARSGSKTLEVKRMTGNTTMQVVGETVEFKKYLEEKYALPVLAFKVDVIGLGAGVYDRLIELDLPAVAVNNAEVHTMIDKERYSNIRAEMAWAFRYRMEHFGVGLADFHTTDYEIKDYVRGDIQAIRYRITSQGKIQIAQKDEIRKILGRSPDYWDALVLSYESPGGGPPSIEFIPSDPNEKKDMSDEEWKILLGLTVPVDHESFYETFT